MTSKRSDNIITILLAVAICVIAIQLGNRLWKSQGTTDLPVAEYVNGWESLRSKGVLPAQAASAVTLIEFADLQCPSCKRQHDAIRSVSRKHGDQLDFVFIHYPLAYHAHAFPAAVALECAAAQGKFLPFLDEAYERQEDLGTIPLDSIAILSKIPRMGDFRTCRQDSVISERVRMGIDLGREFAVEGTPTLIVNGWRYRGALTEKELERVMEELLAGRPLGFRPVAPRQTGVNTRRHDRTSFEQAPRLSISPQPVLVVGGYDADEAFDLTGFDDAKITRGNGITALVSGNRVLSFQTNQAPKLVGRAGRGPGEFIRVHNLAKGIGDTIVLVDGALRRFTKWDPNTNEFVTDAIQALDFPLPYKAAGYLGNDRVAMTSSGVFTEVLEDSAVRTLADVALVAVNGGKILARVPDLALVPQQTRYLGRARRTTTPVRLGPKSSAATAGAHIVIGSADGYQLKFLDSTGMEVLEVVVDVPVREVSQQMREVSIDAELKRLNEPRPEPLLDKAESERLARQAPYAKTLPAIGGLFGNVDGTIWVLDYIAPGDSTWSATAIDTSGSIAGRIRMSVRSLPIDFTKDRILLKEQDADGVVTLKLYRIIAR